MLHYILVQSSHVRGGSIRTGRQGSDQGGWSRQSEAFFQIMVNRFRLREEVHIANVLVPRWQAAAGAGKVLDLKLRRLVLPLELQDVPVRVFQQRTSGATIRGRCHDWIVSLPANR